MNDRCLPYNFCCLDQVLDHSKFHLFHEQYSISDEESTEPQVRPNLNQTNEVHSLRQEANDRTESKMANRAIEKQNIQKNYFRFSKLNRRAQISYHSTVHNCFSHKFTQKAEFCA